MFQVKEYTLKSDGNRERVEELHSGRVVNYAYDSLNRLAEEDIHDPVHGNETVSYTYDASGNRLRKSGSGGTVSYSYNGNDRLVSETGPGHSLSYGYDSNGSLVSRNDGTDTVIYGYDYEDRIVSAGTAAYTYDADGIRVSSSAGGTVTNYTADKNRQYAQVLEERDGGSLTAGYVYGDDLISRKQNGEVRYYLYDGHGSVRQLTDAAGNVTDSYSYDAFGNLRNHAGTSDNRYLYAGEQYDPDAGLYYLRARYYDPANGRFMTHDLYEGNPYEPVTLHRYLYAGANPVMYADPSGKQMSLAMQVNTTAIFGMLASLSVLNYNQMSNSASAGAGLYAAVISATEAVSTLINFTELLMEAELSEALFLFQDRVRGELDRKRNELNEWQLILMRPTGLDRTPNVFMPSVPPAGPFIIYEDGGDAMRVLGARLKHRRTGINEWIMRIDYHGHRRYFPDYEFTLHYHVPPTMNLHHFLWPERITHP